MKAGILEKFGLQFFVLLFVKTNILLSFVKEKINMPFPGGYYAEFILCTVIGVAGRRRKGDLPEEGRREIPEGKRDRKKTAFFCPDPRFSPEAGGNPVVC